MSGGKHTIPSHGSYNYLPSYLYPKHLYYLFFPLPVSTMHLARNLACLKLSYHYTEMQFKIGSLMIKPHKQYVKNLLRMFVVWSCIADFIRNSFTCNFQHIGNTNFQAIWSLLHGCTYINNMHAVCQSSKMFSNMSCCSLVTILDLFHGPFLLEVQLHWDSIQ